MFAYNLTNRLTILISSYVTFFLKEDFSLDKYTLSNAHIWI